MNPLIPLAMMLGGFGLTALVFCAHFRHGIDPNNNWTGGVGKLGLIIGLLGTFTVAPVTAIWLGL